MGRRVVSKRIVAGRGMKMRRSALKGSQKDSNRTALYAIIAIVAIVVIVILMKSRNNNVGGQAVAPAALTTQGCFQYWNAQCRTDTRTGCTADTSACVTYCAQRARTRCSSTL